MSPTLQLPEEGMHRETFPDGTPSAEYTIKNGQHHGLYRSWHPNGALAEERRYKDGRLHGLAKQWNAKGVLLGTCKFRYGTGLLLEWYDNCQIRVEWPYFRGQLTGRMRMWGEDGMFYLQEYYFEGRKVSKKGYLQKCKANRQLPRFKEQRITNTVGNYMRRLRREKREQAKLGPTPLEIEQQKAFDRDCKIETKGKRSQELISWLTNNAKGTRELGELSRSKSLRLARRLYALGATKVWATSIEHDPDGAEYSKKLIIGLPEDASKSGKIYEICSDPARPFIGGSAPAIATGKRFMSVSLT